MIDRKMIGLLMLLLVVSLCVACSPSAPKQAEAILKDFFTCLHDGRFTEAAALYGGTASDWTGRGTGLDDTALRAKRAIVAEALAYHGDALSDPLEALRRVGGRELAGMAGAILRARQLRIPVILDGFICCAAAAVLERLRPVLEGEAGAGRVVAP